jgi:hypothetical protein
VFFSTRICFRIACRFAFICTIAITAPRYRHVTRKTI